MQQKIKNDKSAENITRELYQFLQEQKLEEKIAIKIKKLEDKKLLKKINDNIKKAQKSNNQNKITSENRTHLRKLEYLQMQFKEVSFYK